MPKENLEKLTIFLKDIKDCDDCPLHDICRFIKRNCFEGTTICEDLNVNK